MWTLKPNGEGQLTGDGACAYPENRRAWPSAGLLYDDSQKQLAHENLPAAITRAVAQIDAAVDHLYRSAIGNR